MGAQSQIAKARDTARRANSSQGPLPVHMSRNPRSLR